MIAKGADRRSKGEQDELSELRERHLDAGPRLQDLPT